MKYIAILVEGQTEQEFVDQILQPYGQENDIWFTPVIVATARAAAGVKFRGGGGWKHYHDDLVTLFQGSHWFKVGLLIDFYGYPRDGPGGDAPGVGRERHKLMLEALSARYSDRRFEPCVALHEFETWVIAAALRRGRVLGRSDRAQRLQAVSAQFRDDVELIDGGTHTAPSKRVAQAWPGYSKTVDGIEAIAEAGLEHVLERCPTLRDWVERLVAPVT